MIHRKLRGALAACGAVFTLTSCFATPGAFTSELTLLSDGTYQFAYDGEIQLVTLAAMMQEMAEAEQGEPFEAYCDEPTGEEDEYGGEIYRERECTADEVIAQEAEYEEQQAAKIAETAEMKAAMGGIDPSDEATIADFAERLERQAGWQSVEHKGEGIFQVVYRTAGQMPDNFGFPLIGDIPSGQPFITLSRWDGGQVRVDAPLFTRQSMDGMGLMGLAAMGGMMGASGTDDGPDIIKASGSFTIRTDGQILTNNTETGPAKEAALSVLRWDIGKQGRSAPQALIGF